MSAAAAGPSRHNKHGQNSWADAGFRDRKGCRPPSSCPTQGVSGAGVEDARPAGLNSDAVPPLAGSAPRTPPGARPRRHPPPGNSAPSPDTTAGQAGTAAEQACRPTQSGARARPRRCGGHGGPEGKLGEGPSGQTVGEAAGASE